MQGPRRSVFLLPPPLGAQPTDPCPVTGPLPGETQCNGWRGPDPRLSPPQGNSIWCPRVLEGSNPLPFKKKLFLERGEGKEKERERNINVWLPLPRPALGA